MCSRHSPTTVSAVRGSRAARESADLSRGHLRVSDRDRDLAAERLREHAAAGRLTFDELSDRLQAALTASTHAELDEQFADLPQAPRASSSRHRPVKRAGMGLHTSIYLGVALAMIAIWAATGSGYLWPVWPIMGWGIGVMSHRSGCGFAIRRVERADAPFSTRFPSALASRAYPYRRSST